jgi:hypothetical protein
MLHLSPSPLPAYPPLTFLVLIGLLAVVFDERAVTSQLLSLPLLTAQSVEQVEREAVCMKRVHQAAMFLILSHSIYFGAFWHHFDWMFVSLYLQLCKSPFHLGFFMDNNMVFTSK